MKCIPILFNTEMTQAILTGRKTQTRRLVKEIPLHAPYFELCDGKPFACDMYGEWHPAERFCRIQPGDILWVRETWRPVEASSSGWCRMEYKAGGTEIFQKIIAVPKYREPWHPSIHMPKKAARTFLLVTDVRCERLQEITEEQAVKEGCSAGCINITCGPFGIDDDPDEWTAVEDFQRVWDSTIPRHPCKFKRHLWYWSDNPWVWVIEFERCEKPQGWCTE